MSLDGVKVRHIMTSPVVTLSASQSLPLATQVLADRHIRHLPVVDKDDRVVGLVTHRDVLRAGIGKLAGLSDSEQSELQLAVPARSVMTQSVRTIFPDAPILEAGALLVDEKIGCLPVIDPLTSRLIGIVTEADFVALVVRTLTHFSSLRVTEVMSASPTTLREDQTLGLAEDIMALDRIRHVPVVDASERVVGLVSHRDLLAVARSALTAAPKFPTRTLVSEIMTRDVWTISSDSSALDAARTILDHRYGCLPVAEEGRLVGIVTEADFVKLLVQRLCTTRLDPVSLDAPVNYFMSAPVATVRPDTSLAAASQKMDERQISALAVTADSGGLVGVVSRTDLLKVAKFPKAMSRLARRLLRFSDESVSSIMSRNLVTVSTDTSISQAALQLLGRDIHRLLVVEGDRPIGVISTTDFVEVVRALRIVNPVSQFMSPILVSIDAKESLAAATNLLDDADVSNLLVRDGALVVGAFGQAEALAARNHPPDVAVESVMSQRVLNVDSELPLYHAAGMAADLGARIVVVSSQQETVGLLTSTDFARACCGD